MSHTNPIIPILLMREETGWTLGPAWYEVFAEVDETPSVVTDEIEVAQAWATRAIHRTTAYRVTGWDDTGTIPSLEQVTMLMEISTVDGRVYRTSVDYDTGRKYLCSLPDDEYVMTFHVCEDSATYIPVRSITRVTGKRVVTLVANMP